MLFQIRQITVQRYEPRKTIIQARIMKKDRFLPSSSNKMLSGLMSLHKNKWHGKSLCQWGLFNNEKKKPSIQRVIRRFIRFRKTLKMWQNLQSKLMLQAHPWTEWGGGGGGGGYCTRYRAINQFPYKLTVAVPSFPVCAPALKGSWLIITAEFVKRIPRERNEEACEANMMNNCSVLDVGGKNLRLMYSQGK